MPLIPTDRILGPRDLHGAQSPEHYLALAAQTIAAGRARYPDLLWPDPWLHVGRAAVVVNHSAAKVPCACGNYPLYDAAWRLAVCFECGATYRQDPPPDWDAGCAVLLARARPEHRNWTTETVDELRAENAREGETWPT